MTSDRDALIGYLHDMQDEHNDEAIPTIYSVNKIADLIISRERRLTERVEKAVKVLKKIHKGKADGKIYIDPVVDEAIAILEGEKT